MNTDSMLRSASRSPLALGFALAAVLGVTACTPIVIGGGDGTGGAGEGGSTGTGIHGGSGGAIAVQSNAIAIPYLLLGGDTPPSQTGTSGGNGGGASVDPNALLVQIANYAQGCSNNPGPDCDGGFTWQISVTIPSALQVPGVLQLSDPSLNGFFSESLSDAQNTGDCSGGGGSFVQGTLEIVSIDSGTIVVKLAGTSPGVTDFDADGEYSAPICPTGV